MVFYRREFTFALRFAFSFPTVLAFATFFAAFGVAFFLGVPFVAAFGAAFFFVSAFAFAVPCALRLTPAFAPLGCVSCACAAARRAIGTRNGEQDT